MVTSDTPKPDTGNTTASSSSLEVNCPTCGAVVVWSREAAYRPFCSKRCHLIDLGDWVTEGHRIPGEPSMDALMDEEFDESGFFRDPDSQG